MFEQNAGTLDRIARIVLGVGLLSIVFVGPATPIGWIGLVPLLTGIAGYCPAYPLLKIRTTAPKM
jgi:hypothetical protein